ncbi:hypothetical protein D3C80_2055110 [compost metagenome]
MTKAVWQEWRGQPLLNHGLFADIAHQFVVLEQFGDTLMHLHMVVGVTHTRLEGAHQRQHFGIEVRHQLREITAALACVGTR